MIDALFMGIDVGTQGARVIVVTDNGTAIAQSARPFKPEIAARAQKDRFEQSPEDWWNACREGIRECLSDLRQSGRNAGDILSLSVTSTSGTVIPLDMMDRPLGNAIMYNDGRSAAEAGEINEAAGELCRRLGYRFGSSFGLPKMVWLCRNTSRLPGKMARLCHAGDFITGRICGEYGITDQTNALKSGYDLMQNEWPAFISEKLGLPENLLPRVVPSGTPIGSVTPECAADTGLSVQTAVVAGMTDGCASQAASGAVYPGSWNSTIGTTLVVKGVTTGLITDPLGRIYSHRHPEGHWMPGGTGNTGGAYLEAHFSGESLDNLNRLIDGRQPSGLMVYPLLKNEDRFPILKRPMSGFVAGNAPDRISFYQAALEGIAFVEKLAFEVLGHLGADVGTYRIHAAGGAVKSVPWLKIRASVLEKTIVKPRIPGACMGAAITAASRIHFGSLSRAAAAMVKAETEVEPVPGLIDGYKCQYGLFKRELEKRGYLTEGA